MMLWPYVDDCFILAQIIPKTFRIDFHEEKNWNFSSKKFYVADLNKCHFQWLSDDFRTFFDFAKLWKK